MILDERLEQALRAQEPVKELRSLVTRLYSEGHERAAVLEIFEKARRHLRQAGREADEDAVMEVMDFLVGWCSPHVKLPADHTRSASTGAGEAE